MEKVLAVLRENLNGEEFVMDHPRRTLEEFFLDVIAKAKNESVETSGALGGGIADYLSAEKDEESAVIKSLIGEESPAKVRETPEVAAAKLAGELKAAEEERVAALTAGNEEKPVAKAEEKVKADAEALKAADAKLDDLLKNR